MRIAQRRSAVVAAVITVCGLLVAPAAAGEGATCARPESDAQSLAINTNAVWDHADLTIAVVLHPQATAAERRAVLDAIGTWSTVLQECLDGGVSLTLVPYSADADIVFRFVQHYGGVSRGAVAICGGPSACTVISSSIPPPGSPFTRYDYADVYDTALHEIGHVLGLGHTTNIESQDLMGYGWGLGEVRAILSDCDVDALYAIWSWAITGQPTSVGTSYSCT